jgi:hypothetical protein
MGGPTEAARQAAALYACRQLTGPSFMSGLSAMALWPIAEMIHIISRVPDDERCR